jgi:hypothetical protein
VGKPLALNLGDPYGVNRCSLLAIFPPLLFVATLALPKL